VAKIHSDLQIMSINFWYCLFTGCLAGCIIIAALANVKQSAQLIISKDGKETRLLLCKALLKIIAIILVLSEILLLSLLGYSILIVLSILRSRFNYQRQGNALNIIVLMLFFLIIASLVLKLATRA